LNAAIRAIEYYLPPKTLSNEELVREFPEWNAEKIRTKTGIESRHLAGESEWASDMAVEAGRNLFASGICAAADIDFILLCTQSPDYLFPTTACLVQQRLGISTDAGAWDMNLGCSGYVYGLSAAKGLIETGQARNVLLLTSDTYCKFMDPRDFSVRVIFGDAASATLVRGEENASDDGSAWIGPFVFGTDGSGAENLIFRRGGARHAASQPQSANGTIPSEHVHDPTALFMNGPEIFTFTLRTVPDCVERLLRKAGASLGDVDLFVFHQANEFMLEHLRKKMQIPRDKFVYAMSDCGNTTSSTIPIALRRMSLERPVRRGARIMLVGFGVGYSWAAALMRWYGSAGTDCPAGQDS
jgi:3-oxoacyl-[acyl-carrier-protein] synthase III